MWEEPENETTLQDFQLTDHKSVSSSKGQPPSFKLTN